MDKLTKVVLGLFVVLAVATVVLAVMVFTEPAPEPEKYIETIENRFLDVNRDGAVDWVKEAEVVINRERLGVLPAQTPTMTPPNFTQPQTIP